MTKLSLVAGMLLIALNASAISKGKYNVGDEKKIWQIDIIKGSPNPEDGFYETTFKCIKETKNTYVFVEKDSKPEYIPSQETIDKITKHFDENISKFNEYFGKPTDIDENGKFVLALTRIRDWYYYNIPAPSDTPPVAGYMVNAFIDKSNVDYLTIDAFQPEIDTYGTLVHEYTHNVYAHYNSKTADSGDRGLNEALANFAIFLNGTSSEDKYLAMELNILKTDLNDGNFYSPFDGSVDYFNLGENKTHHAYAAGYLLMYYLTQVKLKNNEKAQRAFIKDLVQNNIDLPSHLKLKKTMVKFKLLHSECEFDSFYFDEFKGFVNNYFKSK